MSLDDDFPPTQAAPPPPPEPPRRPARRRREVSEATHTQEVYESIELMLPPRTWKENPMIWIGLVVAMFLAVPLLASMATRVSFCRMERSRRGRILTASGSIPEWPASGAASACAAPTARPGAG